MAIGIMPTVGEPVTCDAPCAHLDCKATRELTGMLCAICGKPVKAGDAYYETPRRAKMAGQRAIAHAICEEEAADV